MKKLILLPLVGLLMMIPGDVSGFVRGGGGRPAPAPHPAPVMHTPAFSAPHPAPAFHPAAVRPAVRSSAFIPHTSAAVGGSRNVGRTSVGRVGGVNRSSVGVRNLRSVPNRSAYTSRGIYVNRSNGGLYRPGYARNYNNYAGWHHGYWNGWYTRPWLWGGGGLGAGWLLSSAYANYWNPYYSASLMPFYDYGQALAVPDPELLDPGYDDGTGGYPPPDQVANDSTDPNAVAAAQLVDQSRQAFKALDYEKAQQLIDKAVSVSPKDPTLHEFRALVLFARQKFPEATATIYGVLAVAPGWDWTTLQSFYADTKTYEQQLRALESVAKANPNDAGSRFLLAYHYLTIEDRSAAMRMLKSVITLQPKDMLAVHLLNMLEGQGGDTNRPTSGAS